MSREELEDEVVYLREEMGMTANAVAVAQYQSLGLTRREARVFVSLQTAKRPLDAIDLECALDPLGDDRNLTDLTKTYVSRIRKKLGPDTIKTHWGIGYSA